MKRITPSLLDNNRGRKYPPRGEALHFLVSFPVRGAREPYLSQHASQPARAPPKQWPPRRPAKATLISEPSREVGTGNTRLPNGRAFEESVRTATERHWSGFRDTFERVPNTVRGLLLPLGSSHIRASLDLHTYRSISNVL